MADNVRFGLIGYGAWGQCHAAAIAKTAGAELAALCVKSEASATRARQEHPNAWITNDYRELLARPELEVVDIVLPTDLHREVAVAALAAGKHLLLEKPMGLHLEDCRAILKAQRESGRLLAIGHELRLSSLWGEVKSIIRAGTIGVPSYVLVELSRKPYRQGAEGWRYDPVRVGSWVLEEPIHFFDLARWYLEDVGPPETIYATASTRDRAPSNLHDNFSAIVNFAGGAYAVVSQTLAAFEHHQTVKVTGSKGAIWASWSGAMDRTWHPTYSLRVFDGTAVASFPIEVPAGELYELEAEIAMMVAGVQTGSAPVADGVAGLWSVGLCLAAEESVTRGAPVSVDEMIRMG